MAVVDIYGAFCFDSGFSEEEQMKLEDMELNCRKRHSIFFQNKLIRYKNEGKMNKKIISCISISVLLLGLAWSCAASQTSADKNSRYYENNQTLQVKNEVYTFERERNEANIYNVTINYPQLEGSIGQNKDINKANSLLKDAAFSMYAKTYVEAVAQLEEEVQDAHAYAGDVINSFAETFQKQVSASTTGEGFDRFSSQNIGLDQQYLYIYFPFENGISFHGYYILGIPRNQLD